MARRGRQVVRYVTRKAKSKYRRPRKADGMRVAKKAAMGAATGMLVSGALTVAGQRMGQPLMIEAGQRVGSVVSTHFGGTAGNAAFQAADAVFDRVVSIGGNSISGTNGVAYI